MRLKRTMNKLAWTLVAALVILIASCENKLATVETDQEINSTLRWETGALNDRVMDALAANEPAAIKYMLCKELRSAPPEDLTELFTYFNMLEDRKPHSILHQYHVRSFGAASPVTIHGEDKRGHGYELRFRLPCREFVATILYTQHGAAITATTIVLGREDGKWKVMGLRMAALSCNMLDAVDYYEQAKAMREEGYIVEAARLYNVSTQFIEPGGPYWHYDREDEIKRFGETLLPEVTLNYKFPFISEVVSPPVEFVRLTSVADSGLLLPKVIYNTGKRMLDTVSISKECDTVNRAIHIIFPGIDRYNRKLNYVAMGRGADSGMYYSMIRYTGHNR